MSTEQATAPAPRKAVEKAPRGRITEESERLCDEALRLLADARDRKLTTYRALARTLRIDASQIARLRATKKFTVGKLPALIAALREAGAVTDEARPSPTLPTAPRPRDRGAAQARHLQLWAETNRKIAGGKFTREHWLAHLREEASLARIDTEIDLRPIASQGAVHEFVHSMAELMGLLAEPTTTNGR